MKTITAYQSDDNRLLSADKFEVQQYEALQKRYGLLVELVGGIDKIDENIKIELANWLFNDSTYKKILEIFETTDIQPEVPSTSVAKLPMSELKPNLTNVY